jgi:hypothetical protein
MNGQLLFRIAANQCGVDMGNSGIRKEGTFLPEHVFDGLAIKYAVYNTGCAVKRKSIFQETHRLDRFLKRNRISVIFPTVLEQALDRSSFRNHATCSGASCSQMPHTYRRVASANYKAERLRTDAHLAATV